MIRLGMGAKFSLAVALLIVVFAGFFAIYFPFQQKRAAQEALERHGDGVALAMAQVLGQWLDGGQENKPALKKGFTALVTDDPDIVYVVALQTSGLEFAGYLAPEVREDEVDRRVATQKRVTERHGYLHFATPIMKYKGDQVDQQGTLVIGLSERSVSDARSSSQLTALIVSVLLLLVGVGVAWLVGRAITLPLLQTAGALNRVSSTLAAAAQAQETSSAEEAAAVAQTRRSMETLLNSAQQIADRSSEVLGNAERSTNGSRQIAERIGNLNELAERITEILATIMQVADKADLLALNASLEGTRAGEAGKGFALVAAEMRRLAESVVESVTGIRELMQEMREASQSAVTASQEGTRSSTATTHSAREIALLTQEQRQATEQVIASMDEMSNILNHTLLAIQRTTRSASKLTTLAEELSQAVRPQGDESEDRFARGIPGPALESQTDLSYDSLIIPPAPKSVGDAGSDDSGGRDGAA